MANARTATYSTDDIYRGQEVSRILTNELVNIESAVDALDSAKAPATHSHSDLESAIDALDSGKATSIHAHAMSDITGLSATLTEMETAISELQSGGDGSTVAPMLIASMHLGKIDNNNGAETNSSTRICSEPFAIEGGKSYWQVNDKGVNMYVLVYDADELFLGYLGSFASGAEIAVDNASAAYMRLSSLIGEYDLTNEFRIYNVDPSSGGSTGGVDAFSKDEADARFAPISHTHDGYASTDHTHTDYASTDHTHTDYAAASHTHDGYAATAHTHTAADITGLPSSVDAYSKTESDARYATASHTHSDYVTEDEAVDAFAGINHTHTGYANADHTHTGFAAENHSHSGYAESGHTHTASEIGAATASHGHSEYADADHTHSGYASSSHTHSGYASSSHSHSDYFAKSGGTITGETNFSGGLVRLSGIQTLFHSGSQLVFGSTNLPTRIAGNSISATKSITVDSDERLKENIDVVDVDKCVDFVKGIKVKTFNYIDDKTQPCIGVIAQDLAESDMAKFFVSTMPGDGDYLAVKATDLVFPLIVAVQELSKRIEKLEC